MRTAGSESLNSLRPSIQRAAATTLLVAAAFGCSSQNTVDRAPRLTGDQESGWTVTFAGVEEAGELQVFTGGSAELSAGRAAVLGDISRGGAGLTWTPRYALRPGQQYIAVWRPSAGEVLSATFTIPALDLAATTTVVGVYPSTEVVPENLLRLYIQFSAPMSRGSARMFVDLLDEDSEPIAGAFVVPEQELWTPAEDRLTLFFDPGRLKQEVGPNLTAGAPLSAGQTVTVRVRREWPDARGALLRDSFERTWRVGEADRERPQTDAWTIRAPQTPAEALSVEFPRALDVALLHRMLTVETQTGAPIAGEISVAPGERDWSFSPAVPWEPGDYAIRVEADLEDLAGNSLERLFDEPLIEDQVGRPALGAVRLRFTVEPG